ncbi:Hypothetical_protein [Hexamita inflata]|uniref:Hypothetical_protein n=1 Tax=Hexamita inflata TaxID=28002 RepID=A0AA86U2L6_9EUKA|nr:Hypothetical protein HINF_LOCUS25171 [Hexamita inflata]
MNIINIKQQASTPVSAVEVFFYLLVSQRSLFYTVSRKYVISKQIIYTLQQQTQIKLFGVFSSIKTGRQTTVSACSFWQSLSFLSQHVFHSSQEITYTAKTATTIPHAQYFQSGEQSLQQNVCVLCNIFCHIQIGTIIM